MVRIRNENNQNHYIAIASVLFIWLFISNVRDLSHNRWYMMTGEGMDSTLSAVYLHPASR